MKIFLMITVLAFPLSSPAGAPPLGGKAIPLENVLRAMTIADVTNQKLWCSPATQVGPRVFITAAHCVPALYQVKELRVRGIKGDEFVGYTAVPAISPLTDENSVDTPTCRAMIDTKNDGATLTREEMKSCWAADGSMDIALLVTERPIQGKMVSIASSPSQDGNRLDLLGWYGACGVPSKNYRMTSFQIFDYIGAQAVMDGSITNSWACPGESGGVYFNGSMEATAINSGGTNPSHLVVHLFGKEIHLPPNFAGGADLTLPDTRRWLHKMVTTYNLDICGMNITCPTIQWPSSVLSN